MDYLLIIGLTVTICIFINIISAYLVNYKCQKAILRSQVNLEIKLANEKVYLDSLKSNLEAYLRQMTRIQKKDHMAVKKLKK